MVSSMTEAIVHCLLLLLLLLNCFSRVRLCAASQMTAHQAPSSLGSSRQEHWTGLPFPSLMHEVKSESQAAQSCPICSKLRDCSLPGSSFHGSFQARLLEWVAIAFSQFIAQVNISQSSTLGLFLTQSTFNTATGTVVFLQHFVSDFTTLLH